MKKFLILPLCALSLFAIDSTLQDRGVDVSINGKIVTTKRAIADVCYDVKMDANASWGGNFAAPSVPNECKKTYVTTFGTISPVKFDGIETFGELETLDFMQEMTKNSQKYILVDSRMPSWYQSGTIAGATNLPFMHFVQPKKFTKEYNEHLKTLGVVIKDGKLDFSGAKNALFFCNGIWCGQSPQAITALVKLGYPKEKMFWYRGGMQDWTSVGLTTIMPSQSR